MKIKKIFSKEPQEKLKLRYIFLLAILLLFIMPLPREACFDSCNWTISSGLTYQGFFTILFGIVFITPFLIPSTIYFITFLILLSFSNKIESCRKTKRRWSFILLIVSFVGTILSNFIAYHTFERVKEIYDKYIIENTIEQKIKIGMTKEEVLKVYPEAIKNYAPQTYSYNPQPINYTKKIKFYDESKQKMVTSTNKVYTSKGHTDMFIFHSPNIREISGYGEDCLRPQKNTPTIYICFKENKVFAIVTGYKNIIVHKDYFQTLQNYNTNDHNLCEKIKTAPYYMGYPSFFMCYTQMAINDQNIRKCDLITDITSKAGCFDEICKSVHPDDEIQATECLYNEIIKTKDLLGCKLINTIQGKKLYYACLTAISATTYETKGCYQILENNEAQENCKKIVEDAYYRDKNIPR